MHVFKRGMVLTVLMLVLVVSTLSSAEVIIYSEMNFQGRSVTLTSNAPDLRLPTINLNDKVRSIRIKNASSVALFTDINYKGKCETFTGDVANLLIKQVGILGVSSIKINAACPQKKAGVIFYKQKNFQGESERVTADTEFLSIHPVGSVKLDGVSTVALFAKSSYDGNCDILAADESDLNHTNLLENEVRSVKLNGNCRCNKAYAMLYTGKNYTGRSFRLTHGVPELSNRYWGKMKNKVSSIKIFNMNAAALYPGENYQGRCYTIKNHIPDLGQTPLKDNGLSSIKFNFECQNTKMLKLRNNSAAVVRFDWQFDGSSTWEKKRLAAGRELVLNLEEGKRLKLEVYYIYPAMDTATNFQNIVMKCNYTIIMNTGHMVLAKGTLINPSCEHVIIPNP